ncbi:hypothetical protein [Desulfofundulus australicus]|uniref:hypothetical protein n=1 Tax=Desulfofundulus australicus TaxID=1566 RepID=UPI001041E0FE|nr:hypothetical protein [Desulfofundulus australicus]
MSLAKGFILTRREYPPKCASTPSCCVLEGHFTGVDVAGQEGSFSPGRAGTTVTVIPVIT